MGYKAVGKLPAATPACELTKYPSNPPGCGEGWPSICLFSTPWSSSSLFLLSGEFWGWKPTYPKESKVSQIRSDK